jgi:hypothetical protein
MGSSMSNVKPQAKKYSDAEVRANINQLFDNGLANNFSEASYSIKDLENIVVSDIQHVPPSNDLTVQQQLLGGNLKFNSSKNRHLRHDIQGYINKLQKGGEGEVYEEISDISEFQKIKDYLTNELKNNQSGGNVDEDYFANIVGSPASINENDGDNNFLNTMLRGGFAGGLDVEADIDDDKKLEGFGLDDDEDEDEGYQEEAGGISPTSSENVDAGGAGKYSETSHDNVNQSSELHILPFYSSDSSINKNPYSKNRLS